MKESIQWRDCLYIPDEVKEPFPECDAFLHRRVGDDIVTNQTLQLMGRGGKLHNSWITGIEEQQWLFADLDEQLKHDELEVALRELDTDLNNFNIKRLSNEARGENKDSDDDEEVPIQL